MNILSELGVHYDDPKGEGKSFLRKYNMPRQQGKKMGTRTFTAGGARRSKR